MGKASAALQRVLDSDKARRVRDWRPPYFVTPRPEPVPADPANTFVVNVGRIVKQSLTKKSRNDLGRRMINMCSLSGWQSTTLNPDMADTEKLAILTARFGVIAADAADREGLYTELVDLSAATMGWAQGIARHQARERKQRSRAARKARRDERRKGKGKREEGKGEDG